MTVSPEDLPIFKRIFRSVVTAREIDIAEQDFVKRGEAFFHVSGWGHENTAFLQAHLIPEDFLHCHYRDKALMFERGVSIKQFFLSLFCKDGSHSRGRQMSAHISSPAHHIMSTVGPVGNNALQAVGAASVIKNQPGNPIVYCGMGDGTSQQGEVLEAIAQAVRETLPVLFVIQDNTFAISTRTEGKTFFSRPDGNAQEFYGIPIERIAGHDPAAAYRQFGEIIAKMRRDRKPAIILFLVQRLDNHTNADDQRSYRTMEEVDWARRCADPIVLLRKWLLSLGCSTDELSTIESQVRHEVVAAAEEAFLSADPATVTTASKPLSPELTDPKGEYRGSASKERLTMLEALRSVLDSRLGSDPRVSLFGEDLEDPKGDVFGLTKGLSLKYPGRVRNSPLTESTIVGYSVGQALAGARPVCFLQFADFFPIAFNQIWAELGSMYWRTDGSWQAPVIIMATCGGFKPGLGPFHASSMESFAAHIPGVDVFLPSNAADAAGLLNAAFASERPTIFFYPKSLLNDRTQSTASDAPKQQVPIGRARIALPGKQLTMVGWGNTVPMLEQAAATLKVQQISCEVIDLRSISPWDKETVIQSAKKTGKLLIAQEDNLSVSVASEIAATVAEESPVHVAMRRVARPDTFVPCNFGNQLDVLPSYERILNAAVELLGGSISWIRPERSSGLVTVDAIGSSPADESLTILKWLVDSGSDVSKGMILAEVEADKAVFEIASPCDGTVEAVLVPVSEAVKIGAPLLYIRPANAAARPKPMVKAEPGTPVIKFNEQSLPAPHTATTRVRQTGAPVAGVVAMSSQLGSLAISNEQICAKCPAWKPDDIVRRTGIENRFWVSANESALTLGAAAARKLLSKTGLAVDDLDLIVVATGSPIEITPSLACMIQYELGATKEGETSAFDINAACSGYLYGLQVAHDYLLAQPNARVMLITTEVLSEMTDPSDPVTAPIFGDAATATLLVGADNADLMQLYVSRPVLSARGEPGEILRLPRDPNQKISMDGIKVFHEAVRSMMTLLGAACTRSGLRCADLDLIIAHQANQRILNALRERIGLDEGAVYSAIARFGNTSSSSIPLCLEDLLQDIPSNKTWGLCSFGGGFTAGGCLVRTRE